MGGSKKEQPTLQYQQGPEYAQQMGMFNKYQEPWMRSQLDLSQDVFEPQTRQLGGILGEQMKQPLQLPEDVWANLQQKSRANISGEYAGLRQQAGERAASAGMLGQGPTEKYMQQLDLSQAKSIEDMSIDMAILEWNEKKMAKQQSIANATQFLQYQPQFDLPMPQSTMYTKPGERATWKKVGSILDPGGSYMGAYA